MLNEPSAALSGFEWCMRTFNNGSNRFSKVLAFAVANISNRASKDEGLLSASSTRAVSSESLHREVSQQASGIARLELTRPITLPAT